MPKKRKLANISLIFRKDVIKCATIKYLPISLISVLGIIKEANTRGECKNSLDKKIIDNRVNMASITINRVLPIMSEIFSEIYT